MHAQIAARPYAWPYDGPIRPERTALLVCWDPGGWAEAPAEAHERLGTVARALRRAGALAIGLPPAPGGVMPPGAPAWDLTVERPAVGGFCGTPLEYVLRTHGRRDLVLCGFPFELGADTTMREANDLGFECLALEDAGGGLSDPTLAGAIRSVQMSGGIFGATATTAELLEALTVPGAQRMETP